MHTDVFQLKEIALEKPEYSELLRLLEIGFDKVGIKSHFIKQNVFRDTKGETLTSEAFLSSECVEELLNGSTDSESIEYRQLHGFEVEGALANILFSGSCHHKLVQSESEAREFAAGCIIAIFQELVPFLSGFYSETAWNEWFIGDGIIDKTLLIFCPTKNLWWLLCITETD